MYADCFVNMHIFIAALKKYKSSHACLSQQQIKL